MANTYDLIASNVLSAPASSVTFSGIPQTYTDLLLMASTRDNSSAGSANASLVTFNGEGTGQQNHYSVWYGLSSTATAADYPSNAGGLYWERLSQPSGYTTNTFGNGELYLANYASTSLQKVSRGVTAAANNADVGFVRGIAGLWADYSAITSIKITSGSGSYISGSSFYLYGIKNS